jgi:hypothetical protein
LAHQSEVGPRAEISNQTIALIAGGVASLVSPHRRGNIPDKSISRSLLYVSASTGRSGAAEFRLANG